MSPLQRTLSRHHHRWHRRRRPVATVEVRFDDPIFNGVPAPSSDDVSIRLPKKNGNGWLTQGLAAGRFQGTAMSHSGVEPGIFVAGVDSLYMYCYDVYDNIKAGWTVDYKINFDGGHRANTRLPRRGQLGIGRHRQGTLRPAIPRGRRRGGGHPNRHLGNPVRQRRLGYRQSGNFKASEPRTRNRDGSGRLLRCNRRHRKALAAQVRHDARSQRQAGHDHRRPAGVRRAGARHLGAARRRGDWSGVDASGRHR